MLGNCNTVANCGTTPHALPRTIPLTRFMRWRTLRDERLHQRLELAALDERSLRDIGLSFSDVQQTQVVLFWR
jgi:uncharacterized protein YjiS (DUF1127 family)